MASLLLEQGDWFGNHKELPVIVKTWRDPPLQLPSHASSRSEVLLPANVI